MNFLSDFIIIAKNNFLLILLPFFLLLQVYLAWKNKSISSLLLYLSALLTIIVVLWVINWYLIPLIISLLALFLLLLLVIQKFIKLIKKYVNYFKDALDKNTIDSFLNSNYIIMFFSFLFIIIVLALSFLIVYGYVQLKIWTFLKFVFAIISFYIHNLVFLYIFGLFIFLIILFFLFPLFYFIKNKRKSYFSFVFSIILVFLIMLIVDMVYAMGYKTLLILLIIILITYLAFSYIIIIEDNKDKLFISYPIKLISIFIVIFSVIVYLSIHQFKYVILNNYNTISEQYKFDYVYESPSLFWTNNNFLPIFNGLNVVDDYMPYIFCDLKINNYKLWVYPILTYKNDFENDPIFNWWIAFLNTKMW
jgi:hypothetical protein